MATKSNGVEVNEWARAPVDAGNPWMRFVRAIYDNEQKTFLGRNATRWGIVLAFYSVFYAVLAVLFAICMGGLLASIPSNRPTYTLNHSLIGSNPGVAYRPRPEDSDLIKYDKLNKTLIDKYVQQMNTFFEESKSASWIATQKECTPKDNYGFPNSPCFFIKLNKIYDWVPEYIVEPVPEMPAGLQSYIQDLDISKRSQVWMSCVEENTEGNVTISYPWGQGLPSDYFPFNEAPAAGERGHLLPIKVNSPVNVQVSVQCRFWANNVIYNKSLKEPSGYTRIHLYIQDSTTTTAQ